MIHPLDIKINKDYHVIGRARRDVYARGTGLIWYNNMWYVNTFLHKDVPEECTGYFAVSTSNYAVRCPDGPTKPLKDAPPPLRKEHQYDSETLNEYFRLIKEEKKNREIPWDFSKAVYLHPMRGSKPEHSDNYLAMRALAHTYGGKSIRLKQKKQNIRGLIESVDENTQIVGLLGHGARAGGEVRGRVIVCGQQIIEDPPYPRIYPSLKPNEYPLTARALVEHIEKLEKEYERQREAHRSSLKEEFENKRIRYRTQLESKKKYSEEQIQKKIEKKYGDDQLEKELEKRLMKSKQYNRMQKELKKRCQQYAKTSEIQERLTELGGKISPLAVIVLYHCHNGRRTDFIQKLADLLDRPVFAYTGLLGWTYNCITPCSKSKRQQFTVNQIIKNWDGVQKKLIFQEFAYLPQRGLYGGLTGQGDWVAATPSKFDKKLMAVQKGIIESIIED